MKLKHCKSMNVTYLYIDDDGSAAAIVVGLSDDDTLTIDTVKSKGNWEEELSLIKDHKGGQYHGLLLDWQLQDADKSTGYDAEALAQQVRRLATEGKISTDIPIILCSAASRFEEYLRKDETGLDLFDKTYKKSAFGGGNVSNVKSEFIALAKGYQDITNEIGNLNQLLKIDDTNLDTRLVGYLNEKLSKKVIHEIARAILQDLIYKNGPLIDEATLATRLGINRAASPGWKDVLVFFNCCKYTGVFAEGWNRWWMHKVVNIWEGLFSNKSLRRTSAAEKVSLFRENDISSLCPIEMHAKHRSDFFWVNCKYSNIPIDTLDGLVLSGQDNQYPWLDKAYVSISYATDSNNGGNFQVSLMEENKLNNLIKLYATKERIRR